MNNTQYRINQSNLSCLLTLIVTVGDSHRVESTYDVIYYAPGKIIAQLQGHSGETDLTYLDVPVPVKAYIIERFNELFGCTDIADRSNLCAYYKRHDRGSDATIFTVEGEPS